MWGLVQVVTFEQVEHVRQIRNTCREFMTRDRSEISEQRQLQWWVNRTESFQLFLFCFGTREIGYGMIRQDPAPGRQWLSGGLAPGWRGLGLGDVLFRLLARIAEPPCHLEVLVSNERARKIYERIGFNEVGREGEVVTMELKERVQ
jgi:ribosomal protein S18 acetylase RimI-like enzyme